MKIGKLDMHCGNCGVIDYCTEPYESPALCCVEGLEDIEEDAYIAIAEQLSNEAIDEKMTEYEQATNSEDCWTDQRAGAICDLVLERLFRNEN